MTCKTLNNCQLVKALDKAADAESTALAIDALLRFASHSGALSGVKKGTFKWLQEVRKTGGM